MTVQAVMAILLLGAAQLLLPDPVPSPRAHLHLSDEQRVKCVWRAEMKPLAEEGAEPQAPFPSRRSPIFPKGSYRHSFQGDGST